MSYISQVKFDEEPRVIRSADLEHAQSGKRLLCFLVEHSSTLFYFRASATHSSMPDVSPSVFEGTRFKSRSRAVEAFEEFVSSLEYSDSPYEVIHQDEGQTFPGLHVRDNLPGRPLAMAKSEAELMTKGNKVVAQQLNGGLRCFALYDSEFGGRFASWVNNQLFWLQPPVECAVFFKQMCREAKVVSGLFEVWLNRSKITVTDASFRVVGEDFSDGPFLMRMKSLLLRLPATYQKRGFGSGIAVPEELSKGLLNMVNQTPNAPCLLIRSVNSQFSGRGRQHSWVVDDKKPAEIVVMESSGQSIKAFLEQDESYRELASPIALNKTSEFMSAGLRSDDRVRPLLF